MEFVSVLTVMMVLEFPVLGMGEHFRSHFAKESAMKKFLLVAVAISGMGLFGVARAADDKSEGKGVHGVLIDNACGAKQKTEADAAKHPVSCAMKESCAKSGYQLMMGDHHMKFDEKGNELAKAYLAKEGASTHVVVMGTPSEDHSSIKVTEIKAADEKKDSDKSEKSVKK
jgi:hypothetical protein